MNRNTEYESLLRELESTPAALDGCVERAQARLRARRRRRRILGIPAGTLAACFAGFVLLVNLFPTFAYACGGVPVLPGDVVVADDNGVAVVPRGAVDWVLEACAQKCRAEQQRRSEIQSGQLTAAAITEKLRRLGYD